MTERDPMASAAAIDMADLQALTHLYELGRYCTHPTNGTDACLAEVLKVAMTLSRADKGVLQVLNRHTGTLRIAAHEGFDQDYLDFVLEVGPSGGTPCAIALRTGERVIIDHVKDSDTLTDEHTRQVLLRAGAQAVQATPMFNGTGELLGVLSTHYCLPAHPTALQCRLLDLLTLQAADFLERKQSEIVVRESEERLRAFLDATSDALFQANADWSEMQVVKGRAFIHEAVTPTIDWVEEHVHPNDHGRVRQAIAKSLDSGTVFELEFCMKLVDGSFGWVYSRAVPMLDRQGAITEWLGTASNVTNRKHTEVALQHSEARYRTLFDSIDEGYCIITLEFDANGRAWDYVIEEVNQAFARQTDIENAAGLSMRQFAPQHEQYWYDIYGQVAMTGEPVRFENYAGALNRWFDVYAFRIGEPDKRQVAVLFNDISGRKKVDAALRESEQRLRSIIEQMPAGVVVLEPSGRWVLHNAIMERYALEGLPPDHPDRTQHWHAWDEYGTPLPPQQWPSNRALRGEIVMPGVEMLYTGNPDGEQWVRVSAAPLCGDQAKVMGACVVAQDVSELKQAEQTLRESDRRKDEFLATLAHELRNPIAPIRNGLHLLRLASSDAETTGRVHAMLDRQIDHLIRLVDDLMEISRISSGKIDLRREEVDLATVVQNAVDTSRPLIDAARHRLTVTLPPEPLHLCIDPVRIAQVVANLLNNAAKYTYEGGSIRLAAYREGTDAVICVQDNGSGITDTMLPRIFDLFAQAEQTYSRAQGGLGIGLTLVRSLVELHGGSVEARSEGLGKGSSFQVRIPLPPGNTQAASQPELPIDPGRSLRHRVLVVDDNRDSADSLGMLLTLLGGDVRTTNDGPAALAVLEGWQPDAVLLDIGMPDMDGFELARRIRRSTSLKDITLIALTGWGQDEDRRQSRDAGIDHHLVKPVDIHAVEQILSSLVPRRI